MIDSTHWNRHLDRALSVDGEAKVHYLGNGRFRVHSANSPRYYDVTLDGEKTSCTCTAAKFGNRCWHRAMVLAIAGHVDVPQPQPEPAYDVAAISAFLANPQAILESA